MNTQAAMFSPSAEIVKLKREISSLQVMIARHHKALAERDNEIARINAQLNASEYRLERFRPRPRLRELIPAAGAGAIVGASIVAMLIG